MRFYAMGNYYLSSIQQGIQAAHALGEMFNNHPAVQPHFDNYECPGKVLRTWSRDHKTMVLLNGGNSADLRDLWTLLSDPRNTSLPVSKFYEDEASLDGALTCVAIILPECLYDAEKVYPDPEQSQSYWWYAINEDQGHQIQGWEAELLTAIKRLPLAR